MGNVDNQILSKIFSNKISTFKLFIPSGNNCTDTEAFYFPAHLPKLTDQTTIKLYASSLSKSLAKGLAEHHALGIVLDYSKNGYRASLRRNQRYNAVFHAIKKLNIPIVPIHLHENKEEKNPKKISVRIGHPIKVTDQSKFKSTNQFRKYIQSKIAALGSALQVDSFFSKKQKPETEEAIIDPIPSHLIEKDIQNLSPTNFIATRQQYNVIIASAVEIPNVLKEIGRLREVTFREVGEGTGRSLDLDEFDLYYTQLIIWDKEAKRIVGGYRLGEGDKIFRKFGAEGFYISSLFDIKKGFYKIMQSSVELGRSYIVKDYQKKRLPLFLLWKGILFFLLKNPKYRYLYGPLSISKYYSNISKSLIVEFIKGTYYDYKLAKYLKPKQAFKIETDEINIKVLLDNFNGEIKNLDNFIGDIEPTHFKIPILMKQYIKQNAKFISFNVDPNFSDVLDGFMILDLNDLPKSTIEALKKEG